jgi:hydroxyacylglutathione hydrolase
VADIAGRLGEDDFVVVDTRSREEFLKSHLRGSLFAPPERFSDFAGSYLQPGQDIVLVLADPAAADGFVRQLLRIGFDKIVGILPAAEVDSAPENLRSGIPAIRFDGLKESMAGGRRFLDVRKATEFGAGHIREAANLAHTRLQPRLGDVPTGPLAVGCQSGTRAAGACAFLARHGRDAVCVADKFENAPRELLA